MLITRPENMTESSPRYLTDHSPVVMRLFDANQFRQAVKEGDVSGGQVTAGHQVVENAADVDDHIVGGLLLVSVGRKLGHQGVHHFCGCIKQE